MNSSLKTITDMVAKLLKETPKSKDETYATAEQKLDDNATATNKKSSGAEKSVARKIAKKPAQDAKRAKKAAKMAKKAAKKAKAEAKKAKLAAKKAKLAAKKAKRDAKQAKKAKKAAPAKESTKKP